MSQQGDLFDARYPSVPGSKAEGTSADAAASMESRAATLRAGCLRLVKSRPLTTDECAEIMGESVLAVRPRFSELRAMNLIEDSGERHKNRSGRAAAVWRAVA